MRKYYPIWKKLKEEGTVSIVTHASLHARIVKAVIKEKWMDTGYKLQILPYHQELSHEIKETMITFKLTKYLVPTALGESDV